jgi:hypothetical protein
MLLFIHLYRGKRVMVKLKKKGLSNMVQVNNLIVAATCFFAYGIVNLTVFVLSGFGMLYIAVLGLACIASGWGILQSKRWALWFSIAMTPLLLVTGVSTLSSWIGFVGFGSGLTILLLHLGLIVYAGLSVYLAFYLLSKQEYFR